MRVDDDVVGLLLFSFLVAFRQWFEVLLCRQGCQSLLSGGSSELCSAVRELQTLKRRFHSRLALRADGQLEQQANEVAHTFPRELPSVYHGFTFFQSRAAFARAFLASIPFAISERVSSSISSCRVASFSLVKAGHEYGNVIYEGGALTVSSI